jgi:hypothetical protein
MCLILSLSPEFQSIFKNPVDISKKNCWFFFLKEKRKKFKPKKIERFLFKKNF